MPPTVFIGSRNFIDVSLAFVRPVSYHKRITVFSWGGWINHYDLGGRPDFIEDARRSTAVTWPFTDQTQREIVMRTAETTTDHHFAKLAQARIQLLNSDSHTIKAIECDQTAYDRVANAIRRLSFKQWSQYCKAFDLHLNHMGFQLFSNGGHRDPKVPIDTTC